VRAARTDQDGSTGVEIRIELGGGLVVQIARR
jgi:hypothetical protein